MVALSSVYNKRQRNVKSDTPKWHFDGGKYGEVVACGRTINPVLYLDRGGSDVDPGSMPRLRELSHMRLFVSKRWILSRWTSCDSDEAEYVYSFSWEFPQLYI